jgi:hypothetical protein
MSTEDEAQKAIAELNEYQLGAQSLRQRSAAEAAYAGGFGGGESRRRSEPR